VTSLDSNVSSSGRLKWAEGLNSSAVKGVSTDHDLGTFEDQIYFGQNSPDYSIVGKASSSSPSVELGLGASGEGNARTTYAGTGGVPIGSTFNRLMYAIKFGEPNFLLSGRVNANSKVLYDRDPTQRVEKVAPWLTVDSDPYPAVVDGKVEWILDGYTTTDRYPDSQSDSFQAMTDDSLQQTTGLSTVPTDKINYVRSAVKATVDAYNGTVTLYAWDEEDPILRTWMKAFPGTVEPRSAISPDLLAHLRYPEDLFKVQRYQLAKYHVTNASDFLSASNQWQVPEDPVTDASVMQPPYRMFTDVDGRQQWSLTSDFVPTGKSNLAAYMSVNSDATSDDYGKVQLREMSGSTVPGPGQVFNEMTQDSAVRARLKPFEASPTSQLNYGNLLTVPLDGGFLYVEPVYAVRGGSSSFRILQFVIVSYNSNIGVGNDLAQALSRALGAAAPPDSGGSGNHGGGQGNGKGSTLTLAERIDRAIAQANSAFNAAEAAQRRGETTVWAQEIERAKAFVAEAARLSAQQQAAGGGPVSR
jgi:uncharacterized membrane protein (UPF0182 family)